MATPNLLTAKLHATKGEEPTGTSTRLASRRTAAALKTRLILRSPKLPLQARRKPHPETRVSLRRRETHPNDRALAPTTRTAAATGEAGVLEGKAAGHHRMAQRAR